MSTSQDIGDVEGLAILAALGLAAYVAFNLYSEYEQKKDQYANSPTGQFAGALGQAAENTATGEILTDNPIANWFKNLFSVASGGDYTPNDPALNMLQANE